jgi:hypothetical protein
MNNPRGMMEKPRGLGIGIGKGKFASKICLLICTPLLGLGDEKEATEIHGKSVGGSLGV